MTAEGIALVAGSVLSFGFEFIPYFKEKYDKITKAQKKLVMLGLGAAVVAATFGLACAELFGIASFTCDQAGAEAAVKVFAAFVFANQTTYALVINGIKKI